MPYVRRLKDGVSMNDRFLHAGTANIDTIAVYSMNHDGPVSDGLDSLGFFRSISIWRQVGSM
jgi:hypothetical protein